MADELTRNLWDHVEHIHPPVDAGTLGYYYDGGGSLAPCEVVSCVRDSDPIDPTDPDPWLSWYVKVRLANGSIIDSDNLSVYVLKGAGRA